MTAPTPRPTSRALARPLVLLVLSAACVRAVAPAAEPTIAVLPAMAAPIAAESLAAADSVLVRLSTTRGDIDIMLRRHWAPLGAARVAEAVAAGYYDGARFFRALRGFVVQWGIAADSATTAAWRGRAIQDEPVTQTNRRGTVTFAAGGPNTRTVQLFVNLRDNARLDAMGFAPVGEVVAGIDAVDALYTGYGEGAPGGKGPSQGTISTQGEAYLAREFPLLDQVRTARIVRHWPAGAPSAR